MIYESLILSSMSVDYGIEPEIAKAIIRVESNNNPRAVGPFGEIGLFQIRPEYSNRGITELFHPGVNIKEGLRILADARRRCPHQEGYTWVICYNTGIEGSRAIQHPTLFPYYVKVKNEVMKWQ